MKKYLPILSVAIVFLVFSLLMVKVYEKGENDKPLSEAELPQETIDFLKDLGSGIADIFARIRPHTDPIDWDNGGDWGQDPESGLAKLEDENFIIYYSPIIKQVAEQVLEDAYVSIDRQKEIFGRYFYPSDVKGRKLPIYVTKSGAQYAEIIKKLTGTKDGSDSSSGMYIFSYSVSGCITDGIVLNGKYILDSKKFCREVLVHEMNHYVFFTSIDYHIMSSSSFPMWSYEGLADYASHQKHSFSFTRDQIEEMRKQCILTDSYFKYVYQNYSGGESIYHFLSLNYGEDEVFIYVRNLLKYGMETALKKSFDISVKTLEGRWKEALPEL